MSYHITIINYVTNDPVISMFYMFSNFKDYELSIALTVTTTMTMTIYNSLCDF